MNRIADLLRAVQVYVVDPGAGACVAGLTNAAEASTCIHAHGVPVVVKAGGLLPGKMFLLS